MDGQTAAQVQRCGLACQLVHHWQHPGCVGRRQQGRQFKWFCLGCIFFLIPVGMPIIINEETEPARVTPRGHWGHFRGNFVLFSVEIEWTATLLVY